MKSILDFLNRKKEKELDIIDNGIAKIQRNGLNYAQAATEFLEYYWKGDIDEVVDKLFKVGEKVTNSFMQEGLLFKDGSVFIETKTEFKGLSLENSDRWKKGLGFEQFSAIKYEIGHPMTLRSGANFKVVNFDLNAETPITLDIDGFGQLSYYNEGKANDSEKSGYDILFLPNTVHLLRSRLNIRNRQKIHA
jgi:hypothetical protein